MTSRVRGSRYFQRPPTNKIYQYNKQERDAFRDLLNQQPWKYKLFYGDNIQNNRCIVVNRPYKIPNEVTAYPTFIRPHQAIFASEYGYLPRGYKSPERDPNNYKQTKGAKRMRQKRQREQENSDELLEGIDPRQDANRLELSHVCGKHGCINIHHIIIERHAINMKRWIHHQWIKAKARVKFATKYPRKYRKGSLKRMKHPNCAHEPTGFINFSEQKNTF